MKFFAVISWNGTRTLKTVFDNILRLAVFLVVMLVYTTEVWISMTRVCDQSASSGHTSFVNLKHILDVIDDKFLGWLCLWYSILHRCRGKVGKYGVVLLVIGTNSKLKYCCAFLVFWLASSWQAFLKNYTSVVTADMFSQLRYGIHPQLLCLLLPVTQVHVLFWCRILIIIYTCCRFQLKHVVYVFSVHFWNEWLMYLSVDILTWGKNKFNIQCTF